MELIIAYYCAPALAGIKASNIISFGKNKYNNTISVINRLNSDLNKSDIYFDVLYEDNQSILLMVYRKKVLKKTLAHSENKLFLNDFGYSNCTGIESYITMLKYRLKKNEFPHEIGVFLGYPVRDIYGYLYKPDDECLLCGEWKVYHNAEETKKLFHRFNACRIALSKKMLAGKTLTQIFGLK